MGRITQLFHLIFTQLGAHLLEIPCKAAAQIVSVGRDPAAPEVEKQGGSEG